MAAPHGAVPRRFYGKALIDYVPPDGSGKITRGTTVEIIDSPEVVLSPVTTFWTVTHESWPMMVGLHTHIMKSTVQQLLLQMRGRLEFLYFLSPAMTLTLILFIGRKTIVGRKSEGR